MPASISLCTLNRMLAVSLYFCEWLTGTFQSLIFRATETWTFQSKKNTINVLTDSSTIPQNWNKCAKFWQENLCEGLFSCTQQENNRTHGAVRTAQLWLLFCLVAVRLVISACGNTLKCPVWRCKAICLYVLPMSLQTRKKTEIIYTYRAKIENTVFAIFLDFLGKKMD